MATFAIDVHGVRMNELQVLARSSKGAYWIVLEFAAGQNITLFLATETDFRELAARFGVEPMAALEPTPLGEEIPF
jgi:hypothetical protein